MTNYRRPPALEAAELPEYATRYGASVRQMDRSIAATAPHDDLIDLTHGDTRAFVPPTSAQSDFLAAVHENTEAYTPYRGSVKVRSLVAARAEELLQRPIDPSGELIITPGTQGGLFTSLSALVSPGDIVAVPSTEYFMDERILAYLGAQVHRVPLHQDGLGIITVVQEDLDVAVRSGVRGIVLSHPNNPTGGIYARESAQRLAEWIIEHDLWVVIDQLYCRLVFDENEFVQIGAFPGMAERTVTLIGPSKTESMSGYRVGAAIGPSEVIEAMEQVVSMGSLRAAGYAQHSLRHWMDNDRQWLEERTCAHQLIRDALVDRLRSIPGMTVSAPAGSSYVFPDASGTSWSLEYGDNDDHMMAVAFKANGVLIAPGYQFGLDGRGHFRINFSQDLGTINRACDRIEEVLNLS
jgi:aspartate/methionine/tyrosine aminotransferase